MGNKKNENSHLHYDNVNCPMVFNIDMQRKLHFCLYGGAVEFKFVKLDRYIERLTGIPKFLEPTFIYGLKEVGDLNPNYIAELKKMLLHRELKHKVNKKNNFIKRINKI